MYDNIKLIYSINDYDDDSLLTDYYEIIIKELSKMANHPSVVEIYKAVKERDNKIGLAIVYYILEKLAEKSFISKVYCSNGPERYEIFSSNHGHFYCLSCGKITDINIPKFEYPDESFEVTGFNFEILGKCKTCARKVDTY